MDKSTTVKFISGLFIVGFFLLFFTSCTKDSEDLPPCGSNGIPIEGTDECFCDFWYEGPQCETEIREKFLGTWTGYDYKCAWGDTLPNGFKVEIIKEVDVKKVKFVSKNLLTSDTIIAHVDFIGFLRFNAFEKVGNTFYQTYNMDIFYENEEDAQEERLLVFIGRNEDLDEWTENCNFQLKKE